MTDPTPSVPAPAPILPAPPPRRASSALARLADALRQQNWVAVVIEMAVVVLGVLIAFQVNAWGAERTDRARERVLLRGLRADFAENRAKYERMAASNETIIEQARQLHALTGPDAAEPDPARFDSLLSGLLEWERLDPATGRLDALLASGQIALVQSDSLQAALSSWPAVLGDLQENEQMMVDFVQDRLTPHLDDRFPLLAMDQRFDLIHPLRENPFPVRRRALLADLTFANLVEDRWVMTAFLMQDAEPVRQQIDEILRLVDGQLDDAPAETPS